MKRTIAIAPVRKSIRVGAGQAQAIDVFTSGIGRGNRPVVATQREGRQTADQDGRARAAPRRALVR